MGNPFTTKIGKPLIKSLLSKDLEFLGDNAEKAVEELLLDKDGILGEIPVFKYLVKSYQISKHISNQIFALKIKGFLENLADIPYEKREKFLKKIEEKGNTEKLGSNIILLLDQLDDLQKTKIISKLFKHYFLEDFTEATFLRAAYTVKNVFKYDLGILPHYVDGGIHMGTGTYGLENVGLINRKALDENHSDYWVKSPIGKILLNYVWDEIEEFE